MCTPMCIVVQVVMSTAVSKTSKVQVFPERTLKELVTLCAWSGPAGWKHNLGNKQQAKHAPTTPQEVCIPRQHFSQGASFQAYA